MENQETQPPVFNQEETQQEDLQNQKNPGCVIAWLIVALIANAISLVYNGYLIRGTWASVVISLCSLTTLMSCVLLLKKQKGGFTLLVASAVINFFTNLALNNDINYKTVLGLFSPLIWYAIFQVKNKEGKKGWELLQEGLGFNRLKAVYIVYGILSVGTIIYTMPHKGYSSSTNDVSNWQTFTKNGCSISAPKMYKESYNANCIFFLVESPIDNSAISVIRLSENNPSYKMDEELSDLKTFKHSWAHSCAIDLNLRITDSTETENVCCVWFKGMLDNINIKGCFATKVIDDDCFLIQYYYSAILENRYKDNMERIINSLVVEDNSTGQIETE